MINLSRNLSDTNDLTGLMLGFNNGQDKQQSFGGGVNFVPSFSFGASGSKENVAGAKVARGGRRGGSEVAEKWQRRKIRNRESAARSRARKLAYNIQQEVEIKELKEENEFLRKAIKVLSTNVIQKEDGDDKLSLKRTFSGPI